MLDAPKFLKNKAVLLTTVALLSFGATGAAIYAASDADAKAPIAADEPFAVSVQTLHPETVRIWNNYSGRLHAVDEAEIRPEISGRITEVRVKDGQTVNAGDVMFVIDPRPYEAAQAKAEADVATAQTNANFAKLEFERARGLIKSEAIPQSMYDQRESADRAATASILAANAELKQAQVNLDYAYVKAPITGRISRAEITLGNLVQSGPNAPLLTTIVSNNGIYADFEVDEQTYMKSIRANAATHDKEQEVPVELTVQGDDDHKFKGTIYTFDNKIDSASGTIRARAKFANEDGELVPGMFVSVGLGDSSESKAILVPDRAIGNDQSKKFVFTVSGDNKVVYHEVTLGDEVDGKHVVLSGLEAGDRVIVDGVQHVRPDIIVKPQEIAQNKASNKVAQQ